MLFVPFVPFVPFVALSADLRETITVDDTFQGIAFSKSIVRREDGGLKNEMAFSANANHYKRGGSSFSGKNKFRI